MASKAAGDRWIGHLGGICFSPTGLYPRAEAEFELNGMLEQIGLKAPEEKPLLHFAKLVEVSVWRPKLVRGSNSQASR